MLYALTSVALIAAMTVVGPEPTDPAPLLSGPSVSETNVTGDSSTFSASTENPNLRMTGANPAIFRQAVLALRDAPDEIRPTDEQQAQIAAVIRQHQQSERAFMAKYGRELRRLNASLRTDARPATDSARAPQANSRAEPISDRPDARLEVRARPASRGQTPRAQDPMMDQPITDRAPASTAPDSAERQRLQEILAQRPSVEELERPVRALLTEPQLSWLDQKITTLAQERFEQLTLERYRRQAADQIKAQEQRLEQAIENLPPRMKAYIESLPEEERVEMLMEMRQRRDRANGTDRRRGGDGPQPTAKRPPSVDELDIPDPSGGG